MKYSAQYSGFLDDKHSFFPAVNTLEAANKKAEEQSFQFLSANNMLIDQEFKQLFASLKKEGKNRREFWLYCYYCCTMLEAYYAGYGNPAKVDEYSKLKLQLWDLCQETPLPKKKAERQSFLNMLGNSIADDFAEIIDTPLHVSKLRSKIGLLNVSRIYWTFCRLTLTTSFQVARDTLWIDKLNKLLGKQIDVDKIIKNLEAPNAIFRGLSVGFFVARLILNAGMVLKHTFLPTTSEKTKSMSERFTDELWKRHPDFLNDIVWATVNGLTNYAEYFHIAAPVAGGITAVFLVFDISLILWRRHLAEQDYLIKKSQYTTDLSYYQNQLREATDPGQRIVLEEHCKIILQQMVELEITWKTKSSTFIFNATAALLLAAGFTASMLFTPGILVVGAYAVCTFGVTMYLTDGSYSQYKEKSLRLEQAMIDDKSDINAELCEYQAFRNEFLYTVVKNALLPGVMITTVAILGLQVALALTVAYIVYELWNSYSKHTQNQLSIHPELTPNLEIEIDDPDDFSEEYHVSCLCY